jgi:hypothetical protein
MRKFIGLVASLGLLATAACEDTRSITSEPVGDLGFGTVFAKTSTNLPRGTVTFPAAIVASATPANDSVIVSLAGLDSLTTGTYTMWFANDSASKWVKVASMNVRATRVDSSLNALGDPVFTTTVTNSNGVAGYRGGGPRKVLRFATARNAATGMAATDSLNIVLISVESGAGGAAPGPSRPLWARRSQAASNVASVRFGTFGRGIPANAGMPAANQEFVVATNGVMTIVPRGRVEVRGKIMILNDSNYFRPPVGYYYSAYAIKFDSTGKFVDTVYVGRRTSPYPNRTSLYEADVSNPAPDVVFDSPLVIFAMASRISADSVPKANSTPAWLDFGMVRVNIESKYAQEGVMGPATILEATLPKSVRGR